MEIATRPMQPEDLVEVDRILRLAFGTFIGLPDPMAMFGDSDVARTRFKADPSAAFVATGDGKLVGSNFATNWGSVGFFGPLSVDPRFWEQKVAQRLLEPTMDLFAKWGCRHTGLFTFSYSPKHAALYQKFGFWSRFLTPVMSLATSSSQQGATYIELSKLPASQKQEMIAACRELTNQIYEGLDVAIDIGSVDKQRLGDTILLTDNSKIVAFAVCHVGARTEAGGGVCFAKFAAVRPGVDAASNFERLLDASCQFGASRGVKRFVAGVNTARHEAYRTMVARRFRTDILGVAMHRDHDPGYNRPGVYLLDDWR
ncbi:MAG TPA: GNAT family N-acetyltransferase [Candidatus Binataceae bacterium]|nr:GNAT family N-acetyltransferase [Candidatus Binataceae bacterium]